MTTSRLNLSINSEIPICEGGDLKVTDLLSPLCSSVTHACHADSDSYQLGLQRTRPERSLPRHSLLQGPASTASAIPNASAPQPDASYPLWQKALFGAGAALAAPFAVGAAAALTLTTTLIGCGNAGEDEGMQNRDGGSSANCEAHRKALEAYKPETKYQAMIDALQFPSLDVASLHLVDSSNKPVTSIKPAKTDLVNYVKVDDKLFLLTRNQGAGAYAPATLLIYKIDGSKLTPASPSSVVLHLYNPVWMAPSGNQQLHLLFGPPSSDLILSFDTKKMAVLDEDWCDPNHGTPSSTSGSGKADGGTDGGSGSGGASGAGGHGGSGGAGHAGQSGSGGAGHAGQAGTGGAGKAGSGGASGSAGHGGAGSAGHSGTGGAGKAGNGGTSGAGNAGKGGSAGK
ncbi:MAG: hypothetical protein U1F66_00840 [bacterium]